MGYVCPRHIGPNFSPSYGACGCPRPDAAQLSLDLAAQPASGSTIRAAALVAGDVCAGSGARIHRVVHDGVFMRNAADERTTARFPRGKVEVLVSYPGNRGPVVAYWNKSTTVRLSNR